MTPATTRLRTAPKASGPLPEPALHLRHAHPPEAAFVHDHEAAAEGVVEGLVGGRGLGVAAAEAAEPVPLAGQAGLVLDELDQHVLAAHDRLGNRLVEQRSRGAAQTAEVDQLDRGLGQELDEVRPARGLGMDALDPALAPEGGIEVRAGLGAVASELGMLQGPGEEELRLRLAEGLDFDGAEAHEPGRPLGVGQLPDRVAAGEQPDDPAVLLDRLAEHVQEIEGEGF
jgi:hypothetical protein